MKNILTLDKNKISRLRGYFFKSPAFFYENNEHFLERYVNSEWDEYRLWLQRNRLFTRQGLKGMHEKIKKMKRKPKISVIMPLYNPDPYEFRQAVDSLLWQAYPYWELCAVDDFSRSRDYLKILGRLRDRRIKINFQDAHKGIAETSRYAIKMSKGEYVALMDQDDELYPDALYSFVLLLQNNDIDYFYSDRDMISPQGKRYMHFFRPDWSPEYMLSFNYTPHLEIYNKKLLSDIGGFRKEFEGSQDFDLVLRATEQTDRIYHHPMALYSWRQSLKSVAATLEEKSYAFESGVKALSETVRRRNLPVIKVVENPSLWRGHYRLIWDERILSEKRVTFFLVGRNRGEIDRLRKMFEGVAGSFLNISFIAADYDVSKINVLLKGLDDEGYVFFCDDAVSEIISPGLIDMMGYLAIEGVGVAGCKFLDADNNIFNAGLSIADSGKILFSYRGSPHTEHGYGAIASVPRNVSAVFPSFWGCKVAGLKTRGYFKENKDYFYAALSFFREVIKSGERIACIPYMCLRIDKTKLDYDNSLKDFSDEWVREGLKDKYYNPNLTDLYEDFGIRL